LWEKTVTPPGITGGDAIDTTTMHNTTYRTKRPRDLLDVPDYTMVCEYDPVAYDQVRELINEEDAITVHFPDGSTLDHFGFMMSVEPDENEEGTDPTMTVTIAVSNWDPDNNVEQGPVLTEVSGT
jgi:hypothetical protein